MYAYLLNLHGATEIKITTPVIIVNQSFLINFIKYLLIGLLDTGNFSQ